MMSNSTAHPNQLALFQPQEDRHDGFGTSREASKVSLFLRRTSSNSRGQPPSLPRCAKPVMTPFPGMEPPPGEEEEKTTTLTRAATRAAGRPIGVDRHTLANQRHRIGLILRNLFPSWKGVAASIEALRLQAYYGKCHVSAKRLAEKTGVSVRTWWRVLALLRGNGLAKTERLVTRFGRLSVNLVDLSELWRFLLFLLCTGTPFQPDGPGRWVASRTGGVLRVPDEHGWLRRPQELTAQMTDAMLTREGVAFYVGKQTKPPSWTQPWWRDWAADMVQDGVKWIFPTVKAEALKVAQEA